MNQFQSKYNDFLLNFLINVHLNIKVVVILLLLPICFHTMYLLSQEMAINFIIWNLVKYILYIYHNILDP